MPFRGSFYNWTFLVSLMASSSKSFRNHAMSENRVGNNVVHNEKACHTTNQANQLHINSFRNSEEGYNAGGTTPMRLPTAVHIMNCKKRFPQHAYIVAMHVGMMEKNWNCYQCPGHDMRENLVHRASTVGDVLYRDVGEKPQLRRRQRQTKKEGVIKQNQAIEPWKLATTTSAPSWAAAYQTSSQPASLPTIHPSISPEPCHVVLFVAAHILRVTSSKALRSMQSRLWTPWQQKKVRTEL